jgi:hypothetical protein
LAKISENRQKLAKIGENRRKSAKIAKNRDHYIDPTHEKILRMEVLFFGTKLKVRFAALQLVIYMG